MVLALSAAPSDATLALDVLERRTGAAQAEAELCRRFWPRVRSYGLRHLADADAANELSQRVLTLVVEKLRARKIRDAEQIGSFILGTARHVALGMRRSEARLDPMTESDEPWHDPPPAPKVDAARAATCLQELADRDRTVIVLSVFEELSAAEVATAVGVSPGNVRVMRHRALAALRECFERRPGAR